MSPLKSATAFMSFFLWPQDTMPSSFISSLDMSNKSSKATPSCLRIGSTTIMSFCDKNTLSVGLMANTGLSGRAAFPGSQSVCVISSQAVMYCWQSSLNASNASWTSSLSMMNVYQQVLMSKACDRTITTQSRRHEAVIWPLFLKTTERYSEMRLGKGLSWLGFQTRRHILRTTGTALSSSPSTTLDGLLQQSLSHPVEFRLECVQKYQI